MLSKNKILSIIHIIFWSIIIFGIINIILTDFQAIQNEIIKLLNEGKILNLIWQIVLIFLDSLLDHFTLTGIYITAVIAIKSSYREKLNYNDFGKNQEYYRDILKKYTPGVLSYIDGFKADINTLVATLMYLELNNYIKLENKNWIIMNNNDENLNLNEKYVMSCIKNKMLKSFNYDQFEKYCGMDSFNKKLLNNKKNNYSDMPEEEQEYQRKRKRKYTIIKVILIIIFLVLLFFSSYIFDRNVSKNTTLIFASIISFIILSSFIFYLFFFSIFKAYINRNSFYVRNNEGIKLNSKLKGLKNYIKTFSNLNKSTKDEIILWEDYLIYSIMFNINKEITEEYSLIIENN